MTLELKHICLRYSKKTVLDNLSLNFAGGAIHALLGENGAGKSTAANIIGGEIKPDSGSILIDGQEVLLSSPKAVIAHGICYVHQRPMLADSITVRENLLLGLKKDLKKKIPVVAAKWIPQVNLNTPVKYLSADIRFFIALCIALIKTPSLLILDEPTALLDEAQRKFLYDNLRGLSAGGMNIIVITHNFDEAEKYCDTIDFLEDGRLADKKPLPALNVTYKNKTADDDSNSKGSITLIKGLAEEGMDELEREYIMAALREPQGPQNDAQGPQPHSRQNIGIIPTDRKYTGSNPNLTVEQMLTAALKIPEKQKPAVALQMIRNSGVNIQPQEKCSCLSGGMLQKLMFERELYNNPKVLILCNPLQGLDVATCARTCERIKQAARNGAKVTILSYGAFPSGFCDTEYRLKNGKLEAV